MKAHRENYLRGERWHQVHKHPGQCRKCGRAGEKSEFITLSYRVPKYNSYRVMARLCPDCLRELAAGLDVEVNDE